MSVKIVYRIFLIGFLFSLAMLISTILPAKNFLFYRLILVVIVIIEVVVVFKFYIIDIQRKEWIKNLATVYTTGILIFLLLEVVFMFVPYSNGFDDTLATRLWFTKYWNPINSYGFRDVEPKGIKNEMTIFFVGDSYTAGHGIKHIKDRFPDIVKEKLAENANPSNVINIAKNGIDTRDEYGLMTRFIEKSGIRPGYIVLQYFGNDIENIAVENGLNYERFSYDQLNPAWRVMVRTIFSINYFYWKLPHFDKNKYVDFLKKAYASDTIFSIHMQDLKNFIDYAGANNIQLLVVIFPFLHDMDASRTLYAEKLSSYLHINQVSYIDAARLVEKLPVNKRIVNCTDAHPSVSVNRIVGNEIARVLLEKSKK